MKNVEVIISQEPSVEDEDRNHIAHQIQEGYTSGQFLGAAGAHISWDININIID